jgi:hypothetical protein
VAFVLREFQNVLQATLAHEVRFTISVDISECLNSPMVHNMFTQHSPFSWAGFSRSLRRGTCRQVHALHPADMCTREKQRLWTAVSRGWSILIFVLIVYDFLYHILHTAFCAG